MDQKQQIQQCISSCENVMKDLQSMAGKTNDIKLRSTLNESAHHLDMCIRECEYASKQAP